MEYLERHIWSEATERELNALTVKRPKEEIYRQVLKNWDATAKPLDGMGRFETLTAQIGAILGTDTIDISKKAVIVMCSDNGIVEEHISQSGQEVTAAVAQQMVKGNSSVGKMAAKEGADLLVVDIGINREEPISGMISRKICPGTRNFSKEPAMTRDEAVRAIFTGIELVSQCKEKGYRLLATGEMGIGNTTTSSAVAASLLNCDVDFVTGRGAGLSDEKLFHKKQVIREAIKKYELQGAEPLRVLECVGGFDLGGLAGICIGGGVFQIPIVLDGVISMAAALLAERLVPGVIDYLIPSHKGKEPAVKILMEELGLKPVIDGEMALGEGTGAVMMMALLDLALSIYQRRTTFSELNMEQYTRG